MIEENVKAILNELPEGVKLVAAAKSRSPQEIERALAAGVEIIGENYVQEAMAAYQVIGPQAKWHFIGHLQKNKVKKALEFFDMIETIDSEGLAQEVQKRAFQRDKTASVLIEVNSGREPQKFGVMPEEVESLVRAMADFSHVSVEGLMTMGPMFGDPEEARPYFIETRKVFDHIKSMDIPGVEMKILSMGMTNSYQVAIEEGANLVRIGTKIFGPR